MTRLDQSSASEDILRDSDHKELVRSPFKQIVVIETLHLMSLCDARDGYIIGSLGAFVCEHDDSLYHGGN